MDCGELTIICAFCGSALVRGEGAAGASEAPDLPDRMVPFRIDRSVATERLAAWLAGRPMVSPLVRAAAPVSVRAVLVPFCVFAGTARSTYRCKLGIRFAYEMGGERRTSIEWFDHEGSHVHPFSDLLASASRGLSLRHVIALEPYDLGGAVRYDPLLLAGVSAELPSLSTEQTSRMAHDRAEQHVDRHLTSKILGELPCARLKRQTEIDLRMVERVLLPVWIAEYRVSGDRMTLYCNGQSGEVIGSVPTSFWRRNAVPLALAACCVLFVLAVFSAVFIGLSTLFALALAVVS